MLAFFHGVLLSIGLILPLGVQNLFIFQQGTIQPKFLKVLPAVCTASICDTILILVAVQGVSLFILSFSWFKIALLGIGFIFLLYMGWITWNCKPVTNNDEVVILPIKKQILFAVTVSLLNPHAIMDTIGVIGTSSVNYERYDKVLFTTACILISWCWFFLLAIVGRTVGKQKNFKEYTVLINKASAIFMWIAAIYMIYNSGILT